MEFWVNKESDLRTNFRKIYFEILNNASNDEPITIILPLFEWISANSLNNLLLLIHGIKHYHGISQIYVEIFNPQYLHDFLIDYKEEDKKLLENIYSKLVFYESMELYTRLEQAIVNYFPSKSKIEDYKEQIHNKLNTKEYEKKFLYSSKMLALSPLIDNEVDQKNVTTRIETLSSILSQNLKFRISYEEAQQASKQIMFELVKNLYQHSGLNVSSNYAQGFACAQINKYPLLHSYKYGKELIDSTFDFVRPRLKNKIIRFLMISIGDYGIGMANKIKNELFEHIDLFNSDFYLNQFMIDSKFLSSDNNVMRLALQTSYTSKDIYRKVDKKDREYKLNDDKVHQLSRKGYGLVFCLGFIGRSFGRLEIRSASGQLQIFAKAQSYLNQELWSRTEELPEIFKNNFEKYFDIKEKKLSNKEASFPGTQILIEVPVEVFIDNKFAEE